MRSGLAALAVVVAACSSGTPSATPKPAASVAAREAALPSAPPVEAGADPALVDAGAASAPLVPPRIPGDEVAAVLWPDEATARARAASCAPGEELAHVRCMLEARYAGDGEALELASVLYTSFGSVAGVEEAHTMDGGYRGRIRIEPELPVGRERKHLGWVVSAMRDFDAFFVALAPPAGARTYRFRGISFRFMRSVAKRTPTAYAHDWTIAYNLSGSLLVSEDATRETLFHEMFHLNDGARSWWSTRVLDGVYDAVVQKCRTDAACLAPYAPTETIVRGGTYYAFQPGNGVVEYAAELALRYYREQRAVQRRAVKGRSFKCGPPENARAWERMRDEFFGGIDRTPPCR